MLCPSCGKDVGATLDLCASCQEQQQTTQANTPAQASSSGIPVPPSSHKQAVVEEPLPLPEDAGFWLRLIAFLIDGSLVCIVSQATIIALSSILNVSLESALDGLFQLDSTQGLALLLGAMAASLLAVILVYLVIGWFYYAVMEFSLFQATIGKLFLGLAVVGPEGESLSFFRTTARYLAKMLSVITFFAGFIAAGLTSRKQALHDILSDCYVIKREKISLARLGGVSVLALALFLLSNYLGGVSKQSNGTKSMAASPNNASVAFRISSNKASSGSIAFRGSEIKGNILGLPFRPNRIEFSPSMKTLKITQGQDFFPEKEFLIFLFLKEPISSNQIIEVNEDSPFMVPHVHVRWKEKGKDLPTTEILSSKDDYRMQISFNEIASERVAGRISISTKTHPQASISGPFEASVVN